MRGPLQNTVNDANDLSAALRELGFEVQLATDLNKQQLQAEPARFASGLSSGDVGLFYYSGHGFQIDSENYLVPVDFDASNAAEASSRAVAFSGIKSVLEKRPSRLIMMILDSCRDRPFEDGTLPSRGLAPLEAGLGAYIVFAASPGQTASDNPRARNGLFTGCLLESLRRPLNVADAFRQVRQSVYAASNQHQLPYIHDQAIADFSLRAAEPTVGAPAEAAAPLDGLFEEGKASYAQGRCQEAAGTFDRLVRGEPKNAFAQNAAGLSYACLKMWAPALEYFSRAIQLKVDYASAYLNRGQVFLQAGQFDLAIEDFNWALEQEPKNAVLYCRRGTAQFGVRRYEEAERDFSTAIECDPANPEAYYGHGRVSYQLGRFRQALADFDAALARKRDFAAARQYRALTIERLNIPR